VKAKPFLIGLLAAMACLAAVSIYIAITAEKADKSIAVVVSPDGKYKAVRLTISGGSPTPFCVDTIAIFLSVYPDSFVASESNYEVYAAACAPPAQRKQLPKIEWLSDKAVQIAYAPASDKPKPRLKDHDASLAVRVSYVKR
jgi:hypothetical protein